MFSMQSFQTSVISVFCIILSFYKQPNLYIRFFLFFTGLLAIFVISISQPASINTPIVLLIRLVGYFLSFVFLNYVKSGDFSSLFLFLNSFFIFCIIAFLQKTPSLCIELFFTNIVRVKTSLLITFLFISLLLYLSSMIFGMRFGSLVVSLSFFSLAIADFFVFSLSGNHIFFKDLQNFSFALSFLKTFSLSVLDIVYFLFCILLIVFFIYSVFIIFPYKKISFSIKYFVLGQILLFLFFWSFSDGNGLYYFAHEEYGLVYTFVSSAFEGKSPPPSI